MVSTREETQRYISMDPFGYKSQKTQPKLAHVTRLHMDQELLGSAHWGLSSIFWLSIYPFDLIFRLSCNKNGCQQPHKQLLPGSNTKEGVGASFTAPSPLNSPSLHPIGFH